MNDDRRTLRDIAQLASQRHGGKGGRALDRVAKAAGLTLSYTTFDRLAKGTYTSTPSSSTLEALAVLANVPREQVYEAAGLPIPLRSFAEQLPPDADLLSGAQREAVIAVVRQFAAANKALHQAKEGEERADSSAANTDGDLEGDGAQVVELPQPPSKREAMQEIQGDAAFSTDTKE